MEREIKFRVWSNKWNKMIMPDDKEITIDVHAKTAWHDLADDECIELMEFTEIKDFYEKDIISNGVNDWVIEKKLGCFLMKWIKGKHKPENGFILSYDFNSDSYNVIGNAIENPELTTP